MKTATRRLTWVVLIAGLLCLAVNHFAASQGRTVNVIRVTGTIDPASAQYILRGIDQAQQDQAECLVLVLNTPGGLYQSTQDIVQKMLNSTVPVVVYVSPSGGTAASAGCFITMAADLAAMAPGTNIGAAHPVSVGGMGGQGEKPDKTMSDKIASHAASYIKTIANQRHRNADWAVKAVTRSASITATEAVKLKVVDLTATDMKDLLSKLEGREVKKRKLHTARASIKEIEISTKESVLHALANPNIAALLMMFAIYGIIFELSNPGAILPGIVGGISLILALYSFSVLPVNVAGLVLIAFAILLFIADIKVPSHGLLTTGGSISFLFGLFMLFGTGDPVWRASIALLIAISILTTCFFVFIVGAGLRAQKWQVKAGSETMIGQLGMVKAAFLLDSSGIYVGKIFIEGEYWNAESDESIEVGEKVRVLAIKGLTLRVEKVA